MASLQSRSPVRPPARLPALLALVAVLGAMAATALLILAGALAGDGAATSTIVTRVARGAGATSLDARAVYASAAPGVVDITSRTPSPEGASSPYGEPHSTETTASGSGFVIDGDGHVVTAAHVVAGASSITLELADGTSRTATVAGKDDSIDVAVLKFDPSGLTLHPLSIARSAALDVGAPVAALGDPFQYARSISTGIVSGLDRTIEAPNGFTVAHALQTDAALNPGNSGGPLLDSRARVVGVVDQIATGSADQSSGVGFAIPSDLVTAELARLKRGEKVTHAYLGAGTSNATGAIRGAVVREVMAETPASDAGLQVGDVVTAVEGDPVRGTGDLVAAIAERSAGDTIVITARRGSTARRLKITLGTQPENAAVAG